MAGAFLVTLPVLGGMTLRGGNDSVVVWAEDAAHAKSLASAAMAGDVPAAAWSAATATALVIGTELEGWVFNVNLVDNLTPFTEINVSVTGTNGQDIDAIGTALATALNATVINGAAYVGASNVLTIVETTDAMGDWFITMTATPPPGITSTSLIGFGDSAAPVTGMFGAITAPGASGIARTVTLVTTLPALYAVLKANP
jgi:hypothetical protein